jgi:hypothetical protein
MQRKGSRNPLEHLCDNAKQLLSQIKQPCYNARNPLEQGCNNAKEVVSQIKQLCYNAKKGL